MIQAITYGIGQDETRLIANAHTISYIKRPCLSSDNRILCEIFRMAYKGKRIVLPSSTGLPFSLFHMTFHFGFWSLLITHASFLALLNASTQAGPDLYLYLLHRVLLSLLQGWQSPYEYRLFCQTVHLVGIFIAKLDKFVLRSITFGALFRCISPSWI